MDRTVEIRLRVAAPGAEQVFNALAKSGDGLSQHMRGVSIAAGEATKALTLKGKVLSGLADQARSFAAALGPVGSSIAAIHPAALGAVAAIGALGVTYASAIRASREFESALSNLVAITGASGPSLNVLRDAALDLGRTTTVMARDAVEAFKLIASAKPELLENAKALAEVGKQATTLAEATGLALPEAASALAGALNQMREGADQAGRFINVMAAGAKLGAAEIPDLGVAIVKSGTAAKAAGVDFELLNATLQKLAAFGAPAEEFGTAVRNVLIKLMGGARETNPAVVGLTQALDNLAKQGLDTADLAELFGDRNAIVAAQMIETRGAAAELARQITGTGVAAEQARDNFDNLDGDVKRLHASWNAMLVTVGNSDQFRGTVQAITGVIHWIDQLFARVEGLPARFEQMNVEVLEKTVAHLQEQKAKHAENAPFFDWLFGDNFDAEADRLIAQAMDKLQAAREQQSGAFSGEAGFSGATTEFFDKDEQARLDAFRETQRKIDDERKAGVHKTKTEVEEKIKDLDRELKVRERLGDVSKGQLAVEIEYQRILDVTGDKDLAEKYRERALAATSAAEAQDKSGKAAKREASEIARLREAIADKISVASAEVRAVEAGLAAGKSYAEIQADIAAAQLQAKGATDAETEAYRQQALASEQLEERLTKLKEAQSFGRDLNEQIDLLHAQSAAIAEVVAAGGSELEVQRALEVEAARAKATTAEQADLFGELAGARFDDAHAVDAQIAANRSSVGGISHRVDVIDSYRTFTSAPNVVLIPSRRSSCAASRSSAPRRSVGGISHRVDVIDSYRTFTSAPNVVLIPSRANVFRLCVRAGFLALHSIRRTALQLYTKLSIEARHPA